MGKETRIALVGANSRLAKAFIEAYSGDYELISLFKNNKDNPESVGGREFSNSSWTQYLSVCDVSIVFASYIFDENVSYLEKLKGFFGNLFIAIRVFLFSGDSCVIFCSSVSVYGPSKNILRVSSSVQPRGFYGWSKWFSERLLGRIGATSIRWTSLYGLGQRHPSLVCTLVQQAIKKQEIKLTGDSSRKQDYLSFRRAAELLRWVVENKLRRGGVPNVLIGASFQSISNRDLANLIVQTFKEEGITVKVNDQNEQNSGLAKGFVYSDSCSFDVVSALKFKAEIDIREFIIESLQSTGHGPRRERR